MTNFERIGVELQQDCESAYEAKRTFSYSCRLCNLKGLRIECDRCAIRYNHNMMLGVFRDIEEEKERKREELKRSQKVQIQIFV